MTFPAVYVWALLPRAPSIPRYFELFHFTVMSLFVGHWKLSMSNWMHLKYGHNALHKIFIKKVLFCSIKAPAVFSFSAEKLKGHSHDWLLLTTLLLTHEPVDLRMSMVQTGPACVPSSLMWREVVVVVGVSEGCFILVWLKQCFTWLRNSSWRATFLPKTNFPEFISGAGVFHFVL